jgi:dipeptidyl aminopeptidase/acylaminoacyl peptidase
VQTVGVASSRHATMVHSHPPTSCRRRLRWARLAALVGACFFALPVLPRTAERRPYTIDEMFQVETLGPATAMAPDGSALAVDVQRSIASTIGRRLPLRWGPRFRSDIWILPTSGAPARNVTHGEADGVGYWLPAWSPDGQRLAMLSSNGADESPDSEQDRERVWIWDRVTDKLRKLAVEGVHEFDPSSPPLWVDNRRLLLVRCVGRKTDWALQAAAHQTAMTAEHPAVRVLDTSSGGYGSDPVEPPCDLVLADTQADSVREVASVSAIRSLSLAPMGGTMSEGRARIAVIRRLASAPPMTHFDPSAPIAVDLASYGIDLIDVAPSGTPSITKFPVSIVPESFVWSLDGSRFAVLAHSDDDPAALRVFRTSTDGILSAVTMPARVKARRIFWAANQELLVSGDRDRASTSADVHRTDLWLLPEAGAPVNLTEQATAVPDDWRVLARGHVLVGASAGDLWRLDVDAKTLTNLTAHFEPRVGGLVWPRSRSVTGRHDDAPGTLVVGSTKRNPAGDAVQAAGLFSCDVQTGAVTPLAKPSADAELVDYDRATGNAIFKTPQAEGTFADSIVRGQRDGRLVPMLTLNRFLAQIAGAGMRAFTYRSPDGEPLRAWLLLPADYRVGTRYPLVAYVYPGQQYDKATLPKTAALNYVWSGQPQLLASHGYVVLMPSMPMRDTGGRGDPYLDLLTGLMPAVQATVDMGVADPERLAVMGHSGGGYTVYGIITQTTRFKAAIALSGPSELISFYGTFTPELRYGSLPHLNAGVRYMLEVGFAKQGAPPWRDWMRYARNSPLFYVERVTTPLLIVHGDEDFVPPAQAEEMFVALQGQGKRARFVRYLAEGHTFLAPANIRHQWQEIYRWLDEFIGPGVATAHLSQ